jgi:histidine phosphotransferase ChpT
MARGGGVSHAPVSTNVTDSIASERKSGMNAPQSLDALDLAALLCSRVCHDVISPVGAIVNGLEVLEDEKDETMKKHAIDLIRKSATQASARLQFCRLAFGAAGSAGAQLDLGDAESVTRGMLQDDRLSLIWNLPRALLIKNRVKLLLNMLVLAAAAIPRGGKLTVDPVGEGEKMGFRLTAAGTNAKVQPAVEASLSGTTAERIDAHAIQPHYTALLAHVTGLKLSLSSAPDSIVLTAAET